MSSDGDCAILPDDEAWVMLEVERVEAIARLKLIDGECSVAATIAS
jgi:hypothetical protein